MVDLPETPEEATFDPFYTHDDGTHWVHSSLFPGYPSLHSCWFTPDALVMWHPEVFTYDLTAPVSPLLKFPTFTSSLGRLTSIIHPYWVLSSTRDGICQNVDGYVWVSEPPPRVTTPERIAFFKQIVMLGVGFARHTKGL